jgi:hypothetical protein
MAVDAPQFGLGGFWLVRLVGFPGAFSSFVPGFVATSGI